MLARGDWILEKSVKIKLVVISISNILIEKPAQHNPHYLKIHHPIKTLRFKENLTEIFYLYLTKKVFLE